MIKRRTKLLGASAIVIGLSAPFAAQAHERDDTWLYVAGAVAAYAYLDDHDAHRHHHPGYRHDRAYKHHSYKHHSKAWRHHKRMHRMHHAHDRYGPVRDRHSRYYDSHREDHRDGRRSSGRHG